MGISKDDIVRHSGKPKWGIGKVLEISGSHITIFFLDSRKNPRTLRTEYSHFLEPVHPEEDPRILNLPSDIDLVESDFKKYMTFEEAVERFETLFPLWFEDKAYLKGERGYKWEAHKLIVDSLNVEEANTLLERNDFEEFAQRALRVVQKVNLLSPYENMALRDSVKGEKEKETFSLALSQLLHGDESPQNRFENFSRVISDLPAEGARLYTWPVQTLLPYLMYPDREMFLKPGVTQEAAKRLAFEINYKSEPNWLTYSKLLELTDILFEKLSKYKPRDFIDIQSFVWYVSDDIYNRFGAPIVES